MFENIAVAHDGSDGAQRAFDTAVELASQLKAKLHGINVEERIPRYAETIVEVDDLLLIGYHGHSQVYARLWGGSSQNLARMAHSSVLIVK